MTFYELILRIMAYAEPLLPYMLAVAISSALLLPALLIMGRGLWVDRRRFRWMGLFLGLSRWDCVRLACAWIKLVLLISYLVAFRKMGVSHYLLFLVPGLVRCFTIRGLLRVPGRLGWLALEFVALLSCNMVCGYICDMDAGIFFYLLYACMALFSALFGIYLFLTELNDTSEGRDADLEYEWDTGDYSAVAAEDERRQAADGYEETESQR